MLRDPLKDRDSIPAGGNILERVEDLAIVADLTDKALLATQAAAVDV